jgi:anti-repressor protein
MTDLSLTLRSQIRNAVESDQEFPICFDDAWQGLEYSRKDNAKRVLVANFEAEIDYLAVLNTAECADGKGFSRREDIYLTVDCFKQLAMLSNTAKGKEVRLYFIKCEKELKATKAQPKLPEPTDILLLLEQSAAAIREERAKTLAEQEAKLLAQAKVVEMAPKVDMYEAVCAKGKNLLIGDVSKLLAVDNMGPKRLFTFLRDNGVLMKSNLPYAKYEFEKNYFVCVRGVSNGYSFTTTLVTPEGIEFIIKLLEKNGHVVPRKAA